VEEEAIARALDGSARENNNNKMIIIMIHIIKTYMLSHLLEDGCGMQEVVTSHEITLHLDSI
jgi:hypothetical protein